METSAAPVAASPIQPRWSVPLLSGSRLLQVDPVPRQGLPRGLVASQQDSREEVGCTMWPLPPPVSQPFAMSSGSCGDSPCAAAPAHLTDPLMLQTVLAGVLGACGRECRPPLQARAGWLWHATSGSVVHEHSLCDVGQCPGVSHSRHFLSVLDMQGVVVGLPWRYVTVRVLAVLQVCTDAPAARAAMTATSC